MKLDSDEGELNSKKLSWSQTDTYACMVYAHGWVHTIHIHNDHKYTIQSVCSVC